MKIIQTMGVYVLVLGLFKSVYAVDAAHSKPRPSTPDTAKPPLPEGVTLHKEKDIQGVWFAPDFNFTNYDTLYIADTDFKAKERANEKKMREMALRAVPELFLDAGRASRLFKTAALSTNDIPAGSRVLKLTDTIIEYEKGGGGARYFAGEFGAGQPVIKVRGLVYDGDKLVFVFEAKRSGESAGARLGGVFMSDEEIQRNDIRDLTSDVINCMERKAGLVAEK